MVVAIVRAVVNKWHDAKVNVETCIRLQKFVDNLCLGTAEEAEPKDVE